ncbi:MAG: FAD-binding oxidoreductase, partial [Pseudomonadota bacterium]
AHTTSYYAASRNDLTSYSALTGAHKTDVCVIGGGFTGVATAVELAERGYRVIVLEANRVGWGASGRNGGQLIHGVPGAKRIAAARGQDGEALLAEMAWEGHRIVRERVAKYAIDCDLKFGYLDVAITKSHMRALQEEYDTLQGRGFPHSLELFGREQTQALIGTEAYIGSLLNMGSGHLHPLNLCAGEARAAVGLGAQVFEDSPVTKIEPGPTPRVITDRGTVDADTVVLAGNAYHELAPHLRRRMFPVRSFIIGTEPLAEDVVARINPRDLAICDPNFVLEYFRLSADKRMLFGGRINYFGEDPSVIEVRMHKKLARIYPELANARIDFAWGGTIGVTLKRVPLFGRLGPGVIYCQGYSGHGVNNTHMAARVLADAVSGTLERFDMFAGIDAIAVPGADRFPNPFIALGLIYYRLRDKLA